MHGSTARPAPESSARWPIRPSFPDRRRDAYQLRRHVFVQLEDVVQDVRDLPRQSQLVDRQPDRKVAFFESIKSGQNVIGVKNFGNRDFPHARVSSNDMEFTVTVRSLKTDRVSGIYHLEMSNEEVVRQLQQIVATMKRVIEASGELAERVEALERRSGDELGMLTSLGGNLQVLAEQLQSREQAERALIHDLSERVERLEGVR